MDLKWSSAFTFKELLNDCGLRAKYDVRSQAGVYMHTDHRSGHVAYIGKTSGSPTLWKRQYSHYVNYIGGLYLIPDNVPGKYIWEAGPDEPRTREVRVKERQVVYSESEFIEVVHSAFEYVSKVKIHLCILPSHDDAKIAERQLIYEFQPLDTEWGKKSAPRDPIDLIHHCKQSPEFENFLLKSRRRA